MLTVEISEENFEYDVNALVSAFFPEEEVKVLTPMTSAEKREEWMPYRKLMIYFREDGALLASDLTPAETIETFKATGDRKFKEEFKRFLYGFLKKETGKTLPWGNLTGIRPTKLICSMLEEGNNEWQIVKELEREHFVSEEKARLGIGIAKREMELLNQIRQQDNCSPEEYCCNTYSLYIGIPFCPTTCLYCSFTSYAIGAHRKRVDAYLDCLIKEMEYTAEKLRNKILDTIYVGGGTPTTLEAGQLERLLGKVRELFDFTHVKEFTVEAGRPDSITREKLEVLHRAGVTRISINPQTMKQETLDLIGRKHTVEQVKEAYHLAREVGFDNINMDIILGLLGETAEDVKNTVEQIKRLKPDSLTVHSLAIKRASALSKWIRENGVSDLKNTDSTMWIAALGAKDMEMEPYYLYRQKNMAGNFENVGYARPGKFGLYNILIMEEKQTIAACGAGSISKAVLSDGRIERCDDIKDVALYIEKIDEIIAKKEALFSAVV